MTCRVGGPSMSQHLEATAEPSLKGPEGLGRGAGKRAERLLGL